MNRPSSAPGASTTDVVVVGAGPTGLTLAIDLVRRGVAVRVLDKRPEGFSVGTRGNGLQPRTLEVFDDLGVVGPILETAGAHPPLLVYVGRVPVFRKHAHKPVAPSPAVPYPSVVIQPQWRTERILRDRLTELGGKVDYGTEVTALTQNAGEVTAVTGSGETIRSRYLVGADGGRSVVRKTLRIGFAGETREDTRLLLGDVEVGGLRRDAWQVWVNPIRKQVRASVWPVPHSACFRFSAPITRDERPDLTLAGFQRLLRERTGRRGLTVTGLAAPSVYRVAIRLAERYRSGRVFIAGDAAHVHSPAGSQGLNTSVQDAYNLGWKLARVLSGAPESLLGTYEAERRPVARRALGLSTELLDGRKIEHDERTSQLDLSYRGGPLAAGARGGDRAPDAACATADGRRIRLFDVFRGPQPTLLCLGAGPVPGGVPAYRIGRDLLDDGGHIRAAYGETGYVLVRPDGYIGIDTSSVAELTGYLAGI
ncbi:FAD-dependent monooxygenase [Microbispora sp. H10885]|uniref:FAD-dependent monooxygenase n=1 Tax=Microbispora sp. H10885 TaxID=2729110 RepID=UPI0016038C9D|nr:FAD-dependent monooxygenase [Microbispora sp. H10885]